VGSRKASGQHCVGIAVADDHEVVRAGFAALLDTQPDFTVRGRVRLQRGGRGVPRAAARRGAHGRPDAGLDGIEATRQLAGAREPGPQVLILPTFDLEEYVFDALRAGTSGFMLKDVTVERLLGSARGRRRRGPCSRPPLPGAVRLRSRPGSPHASTLAALLRG
jgi:DNA-binding NarL/FixJ family response regulator